MLQNKKILALIPARSGSKRIPNKNTALLRRKPLLAYSIHAGLQSKYIDDVYVSSDSTDILGIAQSFRAKTIKRPKKLATDTAQTIDVQKHALATLERRGSIYDYMVVLQPTSPIRTSQDIDGAIEQLFRDKNDILISVSESPYPPELMMYLRNNKAHFYGTKHLTDVRKQALPTYYVINGSIYIQKREVILRTRAYPFVPNRTSIYVMPKYKSIDIDTVEDLFLTEAIMGKAAKIARSL